MLSEYLIKMRTILQTIGYELSLSPGDFLLALVRRFVCGWMTAQLFCWSGLGVSLIARLLFNPAQFFEDFATIERVHAQANMTAQVIDACLYSYGAIGGLIFVIVFTYGRTAERAGY